MENKIGKVGIKSLIVKVEGEKDIKKLNEETDGLSKSYLNLTGKVKSFKEGLLELKDGLEKYHPVVKGAIKIKEKYNETLEKEKENLINKQKAINAGASAEIIQIEETSKRGNKLEKNL